MKWNSQARLRLGILGLICVPGFVLIVLFPSGGLYWILLVLLSWLGCYLSWSFQVMKGLLSVSAQEVFTGIVDTSKMPLYQQRAEHFFAEMQQIFALLDYKLKN